MYKTKFRPWIHYINNAIKHDINNIILKYVFNIFFNNFVGKKKLK